MGLSQSLGRFVLALGRFWREPPLLAVIAFNLIPLYGVLKLGWDAGALVIFYWIENVVVGVFNLPKIWLAAKGDKAQALSLTGFFAMHYGLFTFVHGVFVFLIFGLGAFGSKTGLGPTTALKVMLSPAFGWGVAAMVLVYLFDFLTEWVGKKRYLEVDPQTQMMSVYGRIIALHLAVIGGAFLLAQFGDPIVGVAILVGIKTLVDVFGKAGRYAKREVDRTARPVDAGP